MKIKQDKYILGQSESKSIQSIGEEIRLDLSLQENNSSIGASVEGIITDTDGNPVDDALIKIMDSNFEPLMHAVTDDTGEYIFNNIPVSNSYTIFAISEGKKLNQDKQFALTNGERKKIDFVLEEDPAMSLGIIAGDLYRNGTVEPINGAVVSLYSVNEDGSEELSALTHTNEYGQFAFREVENGKYDIKISALGFIPDSMTIELITNSQIMLIKPTLVVDPNTENGTVSGLITNENNTPLTRADVILYKVDGNNLIPVSFTKTNSSGVYLFINVPQGTYKVKSNEMEIVEIEITPPPVSGPNIEQFFLSQATTLTPIIASSTTATLTNGATAYSDAYVNAVGGTNDGTITFNITAPILGTYSLGINHINNQIMSLNIEVNGSSTIYDLDINADTTIEAFNTEIVLNQGNNIIKLHGDGTTNAPEIGNISLIIKPFGGFISPENFTLSGESEITQISDVSFIQQIGMENINTATINLDIALEGEYEIGFYHLNPDARTIQIDINGVSTNQVYNMPATADWDIDSKLRFVFTANLIKGNNIITLHNNNQEAYAPYISAIDYTQIQYIDIIDANLSTIGGSANISGGFVKNLGGKNNGYLEFTRTVPFTGVYEIEIKYVAIDDKKESNILVNNVDSGSSYSFEKTNSLNSVDAKTRVVQLTLTTGENKIKIK